jgi:hypothetical protein
LSNNEAKLCGWLDFQDNEKGANSFSELVAQKLPAPRKSLLRMEVCEIFGSGRPLPLDQ